VTAQDESVDFERNSGSRKTRWILKVIDRIQVCLVLACLGSLCARSILAQERPTEQSVLKSESALVVLDVVVIDKDGQPVHGLKFSDFSVFEQAQHMALQNVEEHRSDRSEQPLPAASKTLPPNFFTNVSDTPNDGPLNVLLFDALNTATVDQMYLREQVIEYIKRIPQGTRIAIFGLSNRLYTLQDITSDPAMVTTAIRMFTASKTAVPPNLRGWYTLAAIDELARYLAGLPGRKNLIWFAGSFEHGILSFKDRKNVFGTPSNLADEAQATSYLLTRSRVAVYPIDARGLFSNPKLSAQFAGPPGGGPPGTGGFTESESHFLGERAGEKFAMKQLAESTGGKAFYDTNGLTDAVNDAINNGSNYYTLTYAPTDRNWNGRYRNVQVVLKQSELHAFYRPGYFAYSPNATGPHGGNVSSTKVMDAAMLFGAAGATQIPFVTRIEATTVTEHALPKNNQPSLKRMKPPYRRYSVWVGTNIKDFSLTTATDAVHHGSLEFEILLYNATGELLNAVRETARIDLSVEKYESLLQSGLEFRQDIDAPAKGQYFLRIGVRDVDSDRVGAVEIPLRAIRLAAPGT
jgi:VWFA-related protein